MLVATHDLHVVREFVSREITLSGGQLTAGGADPLPSLVASR